jgi:D-alanyl-D-alanine dipeptidase
VVGTALFLSLTAAPATADTIDFCARKTTGAVRAIDTGSCASNEWSLGSTPIYHGSKRPKALRPEMLRRFRAARAAARQEGVRIQITSGYRSLVYQALLFKRSVRRNGPNQKWVLPPRLSEHPWGTAIDINYKAGKKSGAKWVEVNGYKWGLCRAYGNEWWHFEPLTAPGNPCPPMRPTPTY